jgi:hypothetical protein
VELDKARRAVSLPARVRPRNEAVEYALVTEQGKAYEAMLTTEARPSDIHIAFLLLGVSATRISDQPRQPVPVPPTNAVKIEVSWTTHSEPAHYALSDLIQLTAGRPDPAAPRMDVQTWFYNGSFTRPDGFAAQKEGSIISLIHDPAALINNPGPDRENDNIHFPRAGLLPDEGTPVRVTMTLPASPARTNNTLLR